jgi:4-alpha-glucanotransferase
MSLLPLQDAFGWADRINTPSVVDDRNWTWRVPRPTDTWRDWPEARARQAWLGDAPAPPAAEPYSRRTSA